MLRKTLLSAAALMIMCGTAMAQYGDKSNGGMQGKDQYNQGSMNSNYGMRTYDQSDLNKWGNDSMWFQDAIRDLNYHDQVVLIRALQRVPSNNEMTLRRVIRQCITGSSNFDHSHMMRKDWNKDMDYHGMTWDRKYMVTPTTVWETTMSGLSKFDQRTLGETWEILLPSERDAMLALMANCHMHHMDYDNSGK